MRVDDQQRFEVEAHEGRRGSHGLTLGCNRCCTWHAILDSPIDLAELNRRAGEHTEVCR